ncbi:hypothetical protein AB1Y20_016537 [Prymnesium parvum]|uniref:WD repeat-containing protein 54 beta-propeller domain-containing protein n=1 Tax=Prymnesium parvum TaxID=97485 RepID=A0AB34ID31_PRYPA
MRSPRKALVGHSASLLHGNLARSPTHLAYVHNADLILLSEAALLSSAPHPPVVRLPAPHAAAILQARWVGVGAAEYLVLAAHGALQLHSSDGRRLAHTLLCAEGGWWCGVCGVSRGGRRVLCAGTSDGAVCVLEGEEEGWAEAYYEAAEGAVVELSAEARSDGALVAVADARGGVGVFRLSDEAWERLGDFPSDEGATCTSVRLRDSRLFAAYSSGHIRLFEVGADSCHLSCLIAAHTRWINALELHPTKPMFASAGEDCCVTVWSWSAEGKVTALWSTHVTDALLCGLAFSHDTLAATAYDQPHVYVWSLDK